MLNPFGVLFVYAIHRNVSRNVFRVTPQLISLCIWFPILTITIDFLILWIFYHPPPEYLPGPADRAIISLSHKFSDLRLRDLQLTPDLFLPQIAYAGDSQLLNKRTLPHGNLGKNPPRLDLDVYTIYLLYCHFRAIVCHVEFQMIL